MESIFSGLWREFPFTFWGQPAAVAISGIVADDRQLQPGNVFVAIKGYTIDSHKLIPEVIKREASAIVGTEELFGLPVPYIKVENSRQALAYLAAAFYGQPGRKMTMIGVTGTDGKTTTINLIFHILRAAGIKTGMISTVNAVIGDQDIDTGFHVTTPDAVEVQRYLYQMVEAGMSHCLIETTSHGWAQHRVDSCEFDLGVITNITHEHLDEHGTYENYRAAKGRLFQNLAETKPKNGKSLRVAILNRDDSSFDYLSGLIDNLSGVRYVTYGILQDADIKPRLIGQNSAGLDFEVELLGKTYAIHSPMVGDFNVSNCLAAITATACGLNINPSAIQAGISSLTGVPGRMERIDLGQDFIALVDFAHTPNALKRALETARQLGKGRVITIFGSAGLRDRQKRRTLAEISSKLADVTILTAEDPRTEPLKLILEEMTVAARSSGGYDGKTLFTIPDRGEAIRFAVKIAQKGDIVIVCGKGHEQSMCFGTTEYPWDDRIALRAALALRMGVPGPTMHKLPTS